MQALDRRPRKIYESDFWGDPGFIQICFDNKAVRTGIGLAFPTSVKVLIISKLATTGGFCHLFGTSYIELVQALDRRPRKIYENRFWGNGLHSDLF